jgi:hypothetical protein
MAGKSQAYRHIEQVGQELSHINQPAASKTAGNNDPEQSRFTLHALCLSAGACVNWRTDTALHLR